MCIWGDEHEMRQNANEISVQANLMKIYVYGRNKLYVSNDMNCFYYAIALWSVQLEYDFQ